MADFSETDRLKNKTTLNPVEAGLLDDSYTNKVENKKQRTDAKSSNNRTARDAEKLREKLYHNAPMITSKNQKYTYPDLRNK